MDEAKVMNLGSKYVTGSTIALYRGQGWGMSALSGKTNAHPGFVSLVYGPVSKRCKDTSFKQYRGVPVLEPLGAEQWYKSDGLAQFKAGAEASWLSKVVLKTYLVMPGR